MKKTRTLLVLLLALVAAIPSFADEVVYILYRPYFNWSEVVKHLLETKDGSTWRQVYSEVNLPGISDFYDLDKRTQAKVRRLVQADSRSWGHVALALPWGAWEEGTTFGWRPDFSEFQVPIPMSPKEKAAEMYRLYAAGKPISVKGVLTEEEAWVTGEEVGIPSVGKLKFIPIPVTNVQLKVIVNNLERLRDGNYNYQLPSIHHCAFANDSFNCVNAINEMFKGTGIDLEFIPDSGRMIIFIPDAKPLSRPFPSCQAAFLYDPVW